MNEEELFCKLFPEYVVNGKPLSPYFDLFESGYEQSENRIADLEKKNKVLAQNLEDTEIINNALEKENAELKAELSENKVADCHIVNGLCEQLTKAKEIIKDLLSLCEGETDSKLVFTRAEQFLNIEVKK